MIRNNVNGKVYVGQAKSLKHRWYIHKKDLNKGSHKNRHLQLSWNKNGEESFKFIVLDECERKKEILDYNEQKWIDKLCVVPGEYYNVCLIAGSQLGVKWTVEQNEKIKAYWADPVARAAASERTTSYFKEHPDENSKRQIAYHASHPEAGAVMSAIKKSLWKDTEYAEKMAIIRKYPAVRAKRSANKTAYYKNNPEAGAKNSAMQIVYFKEHPEACKARSERIAALWADPIKKARQLVAIATSRAKKSERPFSYITDLIT